MASQSLPSEGGGGSTCCLELSPDNGYAIDYSRAGSGAAWRTASLQACARETPTTVSATTFGTEEGIQRTVQLADAVRQTMGETFGITSLRANQEEIINAILARRDVFVLMPTGGGKSLCYQLSAVVDQPDPADIASNIAATRLTIVVSPLKSLIHDQVVYLCGRGVRVAALRGDTSAQDQEVILHDIRHGNHYQLMYVTPEKLKTAAFRTLLVDAHTERRRIARIVIDEAHCVSQWGPNFRPEYEDIGGLREVLPDVPMVMLTATATVDVQQDVLAKMGLARTPVLIFKMSFNRPNLRYALEHKNGNFHRNIEDIFAWIQDHGYISESGIIYCFSCHDCEYVSSTLNIHYAKLLKKKKRSDSDGASLQEPSGSFKFADYYHGQMPSSRSRDGLQQKWMRGEIRVMCATIAFGMGIDKANVRYVLHHTMPKSMEGYLQESGRAGRDGLVSHCAIFFSASDYSRITRLFQSSLAQNNRNRSQRGYGEVTAETVERETANLLKVLQFCKNTTTCRRVLLMRYMDEEFDSSECKHTCDNCTNPLDDCTRSGLKRAFMGTPALELFFPPVKRPRQ